MDNKMKNKNIVLSLVIVLVGLVLAGGTYAYLTVTLNVTNNIVNGSSTCFNVDYLNTDQITGTLIPSARPTGGLTGTVSLKINNACDLEGTGNIYLHVNANTSNTFITTLPNHCENRYTLETMTQYTTSNTCQANNGSWITAGTALKYAVYDNSAGTGDPLNVGYINDIDDDIAIYENFIITKTQKNYYIFLWLDGNLTDNTYANLSFSGYVKADAMQSRVIYTANVHYPSDAQGNYVITLGSPLSSFITTYNTPEDALAALKASLGGNTDYPYFLKHIVTNNVVQSFIGFVITPDMAAANPGMVAGTYYLRGGVSSLSLLESNAKIIYDAFGGVGCDVDGGIGVSPYVTKPIYEFYCSVSGLKIAIDYSGQVFAGDYDYTSTMCFINTVSFCGEL